MKAEEEIAKLAACTEAKVDKYVPPLLSFIHSSSLTVLHLLCDIGEAWNTAAGSKGGAVLLNLLWKYHQVVESIQI